jgi:hypothetical protein
MGNTGRGIVRNGEGQKGAEWGYGGRPGPISARPAGAGNADVGTGMIVYPRAVQGMPDTELGTQER